MNNLDLQGKDIETHNHDGINSAILDAISSGASFKIGNGERTTGEGTGNEVFACGFKPKFIYFVGMNTVSRDGGSSHGFVDADLNNYCMDWAHSSIGFIGIQTTDKCIIIREDNTANKCQGSVTAISSTGFTVNWDDVDINGSYIFVAIG